MGILSLIKDRIKGIGIHESEYNSRSPIIRGEADSVTLVNITNWNDFELYNFTLKSGDRLKYNGQEYVFNNTKKISCNSNSTCPPDKSRKFKKIKS